MRKDKAILIMFLCILILPVLIYPLVSGHIDSENHENRVLAEAPDIRTSGIRFFEDFGTYFNDHIPYKNQLVAVHSTLFMSMFKSTSNPRVIVGNDGWLYYNNYDAENPIDDILGISTFSDEEMSVIADNLACAAEKMNSREISFVFLLPPNKETIYREFLPQYITEKAVETTRADLLADYLKSNSGGYEFVYPKEDLLEQKDAFRLYYRYDTHWNRLGGYIGFRSVCESLGYDLPQLKDLTVTENWDYPKDLADLAGIGSRCTDDIEYEIVDFMSGVTVDSFDENGIVKYVSDAPVDKTVLFIHDSYYRSMIEYFPKQFAEVISVDRNYYDLQSVQEYIDIYDPDIVVMEVVERGIQILLHENMPY